MSPRNIAKYALSAVATLLLGSSATYAVPADPRPKQFVQPDGEVITVKMRGDEHHHFYLSEDDYLLVRENNTFYYGNVDAAGRIVKSDLLARPKLNRTARDREFLGKVNMTKVYDALNADKQAGSARRAPASRGIGTFPGSSFPTIGKQRGLILLVEFADIHFKLRDPHDYFYRLVNEEGFNDYKGTGCVKEYFRDNSLGQFDPEFDVYGPVRLENDCKYYGENDNWGNDKRPEQMVIQACAALDDEIDFSVYDCDGDGYVDNVFVFYAGAGEASGGSDDTIWPHAWEISSSTSKKYTYDGVRIDRYACSNEWEGNRPDGIGTFIHEFSHVMGLPDLYSTTYSNAFTPDAYSVMDVGSYNNDARTPPYYSAFERYALGWLTPAELEGQCDIALKDISNNEAYIARTDNDNEFFLFENRQKTGWDKYIPGHGMLVWHIDYDDSVWSSNSVNNKPAHQHVDIVEADNVRSSTTFGGDPFPGTKGVTSFTAETTPAFKTWADTPMDLPITDIAEKDGLITFALCGGYKEVGTPTITGATNITARTFDLAWTPASEADHYQVSVWTEPRPGERIYAAGWEYRKVGNVLTTTVTGLEPETPYLCSVTGAYGMCIGKESEPLQVTTGAMTLDFETPVVLEASDITAESFTANWQTIPSATDYLLTVKSVSDAIFDIDKCDFTGGINAMPAGWATTSKFTYSTIALCGEAVPSLRFGSADLTLTTPVYDADIASLTFWMCGSNSLETNTLRILALIDGEDVLVGEVPLQNTATTVTIDDIPAGARRVTIQYNEVQHKGSVAIDDVVVVWNKHTDFVTLEGYDGISVGNTASVVVTGLKPGTTYAYSIVATDGTLASLPSEQMTVTTSESGAGIHDATAAVTVSVSGDAAVIAAQPGENIHVYDISGRMVRTATVGSAGTAEITLPAGLYIIRVGARSVKTRIAQ